MSDIKPLILVDGSSYIYRAFHAMPALTNSKGFPTGAVYGVINMLRRLLNDYQPDLIAVVFDAKGKTFRNDLYPEYKANRLSMPDELGLQIKPIHDIVRALGLPIIMLEGVEADDVIGTLAHLATEQKRPTIISTGDKDLAQLVNEYVTLINTMTNSSLTPTSVKEKFGVTPSQIIDYLSLVGDTSDNIPGVPQVGPKTAAKWLEAYGSLDNIIQNADKISGKVGEKLRDFIPQFPLTKSLVAIKTDLELTAQIDELVIQLANKEELSKLYQEMEFKTWLSDLLQDTKKQQADEKYANYSIVYTRADLDNWLEKIKKAGIVSFDSETTSLDYMVADIVGVSFCIEPGFAAYVPFGHDYADAPKQLSKEEVLSAIKPMLEDPSIKKIGQHIKYDMEVFANSAGIHMKGTDFDTMLESYVLDSSSNSHDLESLALKYLGWRAIPYTDVAGKGAKQIPFNQVKIEEAARYAAEDADITLRLNQLLQSRIALEEGIKHIYENIEIPLIPVLADIECSGVLIDPEKLKMQGVELEHRLKELENLAFAIAGQPFNMNSPKQLQEILFQVLKLPVLQKTPTGQPSTADPVLQELAHEYEMPHIIIEYRSLSKLMSTYTSRLVEQIQPTTGRIHTSYNQTGAATGRLSSSEPNLQNIPIRTPEGRRIRQAFIAPPGYKLVSADYSQIELRLMAHISEDPSLLKAFSEGLDVHKATAAEVWDVALEDVTYDMRRNAKAINFGLIYGMSAFGLTRQLGIDRHSAQDYIDRYFARYPKVREYMDKTRMHAKELGFVETLWGRRLYLPDIHASQIPRQRAAERTAINAPLQGSAADIIKMAMINIQHWLKTTNQPARMIMQVHDELVFEVAETHLDEVVAGIKERMSNIVQLKVPLEVSAGIGDNWDKASEH